MQLLLTYFIYSTWGLWSIIQYIQIIMKYGVCILGMLTSLDNSVGKIIESLNENEMLKDSIVVFMSDNGAPTDDPLWGHENFGSNWPLRGV